MLRRGHGRDDTTAIDQAAEDAVVERLGALEEDFVLVSEELGERTFDAGGARRVVVDPIDGSVNAKQGSRSSRSRSRSPRVRPWRTSSSATSTTSAPARSGRPSRGGARFSGKAARAGRAQGSHRDPLLRGDDHCRHHGEGPRVLGLADRVRVMGSLALSLCHLADGRVDAACCLKEIRAVDIAAAQLLLAERGLASSSSTIHLLQRRSSISALARGSRRPVRPSSRQRSRRASLAPASRSLRWCTLERMRPDRDAILKALEQVIDPEIRSR